MACTLAACGGSSSGSSTSAATSSSTSSTSSTTSSNNSTAAALVALSAAQYSVAASTTAVLTINRLGSAAGTASVSYSTYNGTAAAGTDYAATTGTVTWNDGDTSVKTVSVPVTSRAAGKQFGLALTSIAGQASFGSPSSATVAITARSTVQSSASNPGSSAAPIAPVRAASVSTQTATLLDYLNGLAGQGRHILTGQHSGYWDSNPMDNISALYSQTGTHPAILGTTIGLVGSQEDGVALSNQWLAAGGIVELSLWPDNPQTGVDDNNHNLDFSDIYTPGTTLNLKWNTYLEGIARQLKAINGPVLFRPFVELNGDWSWWGGQSPAKFIALWQYTYNFLMNTQGVDNALWIYNVNAGVGNYTAYYPGSAYVDIVSWDSYPPSAKDATWYEPLAALDKPMIIAESGVISPDQPPAYAGNSDGILQAVKADYPKVVAIVIWCQNWSLSRQQGAESFMTDSAVIDLSDLPLTL